MIFTVPTVIFTVPTMIFTEPMVIFTVPTSIGNVGTRVSGLRARAGQCCEADLRWRRGRGPCDAGGQPAPAKGGV